MSRGAKQQPAASRRTRRAEQPQAASALAFAETQKIVSNPIFYCGTGPSQSKPPGGPLRSVHDPDAVRRALVRGPAAWSGIGDGKPLPLPPCRAHRAGPGAHFVVGGPRVRVPRRAHHHQDPFLAAYVACSRSSGGENGAQVERQQERRKTRKNKRTRKGGNGEGVVRGCGIWSGWAAGARYAGAAMSCKSGCAVDAAAHARRAPAATTAEEELGEAPAGPTLDLSWAPVVLSARAVERRREQR